MSNFQLIIERSRNDVGNLTEHEVPEGVAPKEQTFNAGRPFTLPDSDQYLWRKLEERIPVRPDRV